MIIKFKKLYPEAILPERKTPGAIAYDLASIRDYRCSKGSLVYVSTGLAWDSPVGALLTLRSSMGAKRGFTIPHAPCLIDADYRGEIVVPVIYMYGPGDYTYIAKGERIAQLSFPTFLHPDIEETDELSETERGHGGFGSTS